MKNEINVEDLSREQLETIATAVLNKDSFKQLVKKCYKELREDKKDTKLIGLEKIKWRGLLTGLTELKAMDL